MSIFEKSLKLNYFIELVSTTQYIIIVSVILLALKLHIYMYVIPAAQ